MASCPFLSYTAIEKMCESGSCYDYTYASDITGVDCMSSECELWDAENQGCVLRTGYTDAMKEVLEKLEREDMAKAAILAAEAMCDEDLDDDGMIYSKDFHFTNPPKALISFPKGGTPMAWESYRDGDGGWSECPAEVE